jgi:uncharacterized protein (DUF427 family)
MYALRCSKSSLNSRIEDGYRGIQRTVRHWWRRFASREAVGGAREGMAKATWGGKVIAQSDACVVVEGNQYFPPEAVKKEFLKPSKHTSECPWKGTAHYYSVEVDGMRNDNAAWYYPHPKPAAAEIKNHIAFWKGVQVDA